MTGNIRKCPKRLYRYFKKHGADDTYERMLDQYIKKRFSKRRPPRPETIESMRTTPHIRFNHDSDSKVIFGYYILYDNAYSDQQITEMILEDMEVTINSPYDCTGKWFTSDLSWHRNPDQSITFVHRMCLDV